MTDLSPQLLSLLLDVGLHGRDLLPAVVVVLIHLRRQQLLVRGHLVSGKRKHFFECCVKCINASHFIQWGLAERQLSNVW